jgi:hypothetical protein
VTAALRHPQLRSLKRDRTAIEARLVVLRDKHLRIQLYNEGILTGRGADEGLLDEKQLAIVREFRAEGRLFPSSVRRTLGRTIDVLESRLANLDGRPADVVVARPGRVLTLGRRLKSWWSR